MKLLPRGLHPKAAGLLIPALRHDDTLDRILLGGDDSYPMGNAGTSHPCNVASQQYRRTWRGQSFELGDGRSSGLDNGQETSYGNSSSCLDGYLDHGKYVGLLSGIASRPWRADIDADEDRQAHFHSHDDFRAHTGGDTDPAANYSADAAAAANCTVAAHGSADAHADPYTDPNP